VDVPEDNETTVSVFKHVDVVLGPTINLHRSPADMWRPQTL